MNDKTWYIKVALMGTSMYVAIYSGKIQKHKWQDNLLIAGAIPPTEPGPGMFPATAAAWAAAAA